MERVMLEGTAVENTQTPDCQCNPSLPVMPATVSPVLRVIATLHLLSLNDDPFLRQPLDITCQHPCSCTKKAR